MGAGAHGSSNARRTVSPWLIPASSGESLLFTSLPLCFRQTSHSALPHSFCNTATHTLRGLSNGHANCFNHSPPLSRTRSKVTLSASASALLGGQVDLVSRTLAYHQQSSSESPSLLAGSGLVTAFVALLDLLLSALLCLSFSKNSVLACCSLSPFRPCHVPPGFQLHFS